MTDNARKDRAMGAIIGNLVGEALGLGCHWYCDLEAFKRECGPWVSDYMDQKIERRLDMMVRLIEPIMLLTIGGIVMFIIVGVLLPVIDLNSAIG